MSSSLDGFFDRKALIRGSTLKPHQKHFLHVLMDYLRGSTVAWPCQESLALDLHVSVKSVQAVIGELVTLKVVRKQPQESDHSYLEYGIDFDVLAGMQLIREPKKRRRTRTRIAPSDTKFTSPLASQSDTKPASPLINEDTNRTSPSDTKSTSCQDAKSTSPRSMQGKLTIEPTPPEWLVMVKELKIYGCWDEPAQNTIAIAQQKGLAPKAVSDLIRFAAAHVIALDADGRPVSQWEIPSADALETASVPHGRLYRWGPPMLLRRIGNQEPHTGIADGWPGKSDQTAAYDKALRELTTRRRPTAEATDDDEKRKANEALAHERAELQKQFGEQLDALEPSEAIDVLTRFDVFHGQRYRKARIDPRSEDAFRLTMLRAFAASVSSAHTPTAQPPPAVSTSPNTNGRPTAMRRPLFDQHSPRKEPMP